MNTITRRTALAGAAALAAPVTLPLLPVSAFAAPSNATDASARFGTYVCRWAGWAAGGLCAPVAIIADPPSYRTKSQ